MPRTTDGEHRLTREASSSPCLMRKDNENVTGRPLAVRLVQAHVVIESLET